MLVPDAAKASEICQSRGLVIATRHDALSAYESGDESCGCGWIGDGSAVELVRAHQSLCGTEPTGRFGLLTCDEEQTLMPICVSNGA